MDGKFVKIAVYVPSSHANSIREALAEAGAGHIGNYDYCSFTVKGVGRYRCGEGTKPFKGEPGQIEEIDEERVETICPEEGIDKVLAAVKKVHPYEEPAVDIYPLLNEGQL
ncbi:MAG: hypothetical protein O3B47_03215 [bacterium]|nr:hypothetical protein [bacterium]